MPVKLPEFKNPVLLHQSPSSDNAVSVFENNTYRWIQTRHGNIQSAMHKHRAWQPVLPYFPAMLAALLFYPKPTACLIAGLGGGELLRFFAHYHPQTRLTVIENNPAMIDIYRQFFMPPSVPVDLYVQDICQLDTYPPERQHDMLLVDIYGSNSLPSCFFQQAHYQNLYNRLTEDGVLAINLVVKNDHEALELLKLIRSAFNRLTLCLSVGQHLNLIVLAFKRTPAMSQLSDLQQNANELNTTLDIDFTTLLDNILTCNPHNDFELLFAPD